MKKIFWYFSLLAFGIIIQSCARIHVLPAVSYGNHTPNYIFKVKGEWNGFNFYTVNELRHNSRIFIYHTLNKFTPFSTINISWYNIEGKKFEQSFTIKQSDFKDPKEFARIGSINIYFYEDHAELFAHTTPQEYRDYIDNFQKSDRYRELSKNKVYSLTLEQRNEINKIYGKEFLMQEAPKLRSDTKEWQTWSKADDLFWKYFDKNAETRARTAKRKFEFLNN